MIANSRFRKKQQILPNSFVGEWKYIMHTVPCKNTTNLLKEKERSQILDFNHVKHRLTHRERLWLFHTIFVHSPYLSCIECEQFKKKKVDSWYENIDIISTKYV